MASSAVALPNGHLPEPAHHQQDVDMTDAASESGSAPHRPSTSSSTSASTKRKRELSINGDDAQHTTTTTITTNGVAHQHPVDTKAAIRDYLLVLERYDATPSLLKRPLPERDVSDEPSAKRKKADEDSSRSSILEKAARDDYDSLEAVVTDVKATVQDQLAELRGTEPDTANKANDEAIARTIAFDQKARELFRREVSYPHLTQHAGILRSLDSSSDLQSNASGNMMLSVYGEAPRPRQLYSSLQQRVATIDNPQGAVQPLREVGLPNGIKTAKAVAFLGSAIEKDKKSKTLGELFPAPKGLPSLQPPKAPKSTTKGVQVGWHRPELTEKSKYRAGSYFGQSISTGRWLDYSNAAPPSKIMTKQRERAMSLAGAKPSSSDLETTEMEALFRGAFSSFAPAKDDSAAMVSSGLISQTMWWQKYGKRTFDRLVESELPEDTTEDDVDADEEIDLDDGLIQEAIEGWDDKIDPSLEEMCNPKKSKEEQDVDDILQDVSDMIQTLVSFQKNRNLTLPSAANQSRYAADPAHSDMLTNGTPAQPTEEETATYDALKAQLVLIVTMLPPYAVARLNSDKLEELNISTKIEIRADEYQGVMEEDEAAARARAAQQASSAPRPTPHRSSTSSSSLPYSGGQYGAATRAPVPSPGFYGSQSAARAPAPGPRPVSGVTPSYTPQRPTPNTGYRPTNGYGGSTQFAQQLARAQQSFSQSNNPYSATPPQSRPQYQQTPSYHNTGSSSSTPRYPNQTPAAQSAPYQQHGYPQHQQPGTPSHPPYNAYTNGATGMPPKAVSPQVAHQQAQYLQQQSFNPNATPSRQSSYGGSGPAGSTPQQRHFPPAGTPQMPQNSVSSGQQQNSQQPTSFHTSLNATQVQQAMDQAKARFNGLTKAQDGVRPLPASGQQVASPVGLGGIGLGGGRPNIPSGANYNNTPSPGPKAQVNSPVVAVNGSPGGAAAPAAMNGTPTEPTQQV